MAYRIAEVKTAHGDAAANELLDAGWSLYVALAPMNQAGPKLGSEHGGLFAETASYIMVRYEELPEEGLTEEEIEAYERSSRISPF